MANDYKNRSSRKRGGSPLAGLATFIAGLVTGLCVAVGFVLIQGLPDVLEQASPQQPVVITTAPGGNKSQPATATDAKKPDKTAGETSTTPSPEFDFYTILPEMEVSVPEWENAGDEPTDTAAATTRDDATDSGGYLLQIGSFQQPDEAERVKARLALLGIGTEIQRVVIDGGDVWHRVRAGPYHDAGNLEQARQRLIENNIDFMLLKLKQDNG